MIMLDYYATRSYVESVGLTGHIYMHLTNCGLPSETIVLCGVINNVIWDCKTGEVSTVQRYGVKL